MARTRRAQAGELNRALNVALAHGDLSMALGAAKDLPFVSLADAARILLLMASNKDRRYAKAAARWISRYASETKDMTPSTLADVADSLQQLEHGDIEAGQALLAAVTGAR